MSDPDDRFRVIYRLAAGDEAEARARAKAVAIENTVEVPEDVIPAGYIADIVAGRVEDVVPEAPGFWSAEIGYHIDAVGSDLPQFLNVVLGNASIFRGVKAMGLVPNAAVRSRFPGARFGAAGLRARVGRSGGYLCPVLKPQGATIAELARLAHDTARAGADIIKEDHGLADQDSAPFSDRVPALADAVAHANAARATAGETARALYFAHVTGPAHTVHDRAFAAKDAGADGILMIPGLLGFDAMHQLARDPSFGLPIMAHPAHLGPYVLSAETGYAHGLLFGTLMRLAGADISVFPNHGGRFGFSRHECDAIAHACADTASPGRPILPSPGGGMSPERLPEMRRQYGDDAVYLLGGSILGAGDRLGAVVAELRAALA